MSQVFNIVGFFLIFFAIKRFMGDGFHEVFKIGLFIFLGVIALKNHQDVILLFDHVTDQWWPVVRQSVLSASEKFSSLVGSLIGGA